MISFGKSVMALATGLVFAGAIAVHAAPLETRSVSQRTATGGPDRESALPGRHGYILMDAETGEVLSGRNADDLFIPASLSKIPTTLLTLSALGTGQRLETRLVADGPVVNGVLQGNLYLVGSGDPSLKTRDIVELAQKLKQRGIRRVAGHFTYKADALPRSEAIDPQHSRGQHYNPAVSGLNIDLNLDRASGNRTLLRQPAFQAARLMRHIAGRHGIAMPPPQRLGGAVRGTDIAVHRSAPLSGIVRQMMARSTNLTAEALGVLSVGALGTKPSSLQAAARATGDWLKNEAGAIGGAEWTGYEMANHSGLSTRSRATPRQMAAILRLGYLRFGKTFTDLHRPSRPAGYRAFGLRGKFGTMRFVRGYGGFLTIGGRTLVFAIMANDGRRRALADAGRKGLHSTAWMNRARRLERSILSDWINDNWKAPPARRPVAVAAAPKPEKTRVAMSTLTAPSSRFIRATSVVE